MSLADNLEMLEAGKLENNAPAPKPVAKKTAPAPKTKAMSKVEINATQFAHALIKHSMNASAAYGELKPKATDKTCRSEGARYLAKPSTIAVLTPLLAKLFTDAGITTEWVFARWVEMSEASAADYFTFKDGTPVLDMSSMSDAQRRNLKKISVSHTQHGTNYSIEVYDAQKATETIGRHLGLLIEKLDAEDSERIGDMLERAVKRIRDTRDLDGWKSIVLDAEYAEVKQG